MTQLFSSDSHSSTKSLTNITNEKRNMSASPMSTEKRSAGNSHFPQRLKNFFRITSSNADKHSDGQLKVESKSTFRSSKFFPGGSRSRSQTVASEGNPLDDTQSPTANANPYFAHQGPPALRHHNEGSVPPSPPDTPTFKVNGIAGEDDQAVTAGKEELARKLRRVASAPNAQGLFSKGNGSGERPATAELGKEPLVQAANSSQIALVDSKQMPGADGHLSPLANVDTLGALQPPIRANAAFRRTYSSNSIKVRTVEVGPSSFDKIKLIGKGDVGKVYLVREKKSNRLYAMKGRYRILLVRDYLLIVCSIEQERDD